MAIHGGYKIIDLSGYNFVLETAQTVSGLWNRIEGTNRSLLVSGLKMNGTEVDDFFADVDLDGTGYVIDGNGYEINIDSDSSVTVHRHGAYPSDPTTNGEYFLSVEVTESGNTKRWYGIPSLPSTDGTYKLTCTVTGGIPALTWSL